MTTIIILAASSRRPDGTAAVTGQQDEVPDDQATRPVSRGGAAAPVPRLPERLSVATPRAVPRLDSDNRDFWTGGAQGELRLKRCRACHTFIHPPLPVCRHCLSDDVATEAVAGTGVVDTFTVNYQAWFPGLDVPYVIARVALDGAPGVYLTTNIVGGPPEEVDIGDRVRVIFEQQGEIFYPLFEKVA